MKKFLTILLSVVMVLALVGCNDSKEASNHQKKPENTEKTALYDEDQVLFVAQDRCDVEDDGYKIYAYNYKGELLNAAENIGYYAENGLAPAADRNTGLVGFVDKEGVFQIEPKYEDAAPFSKDGIALVKIKADEYYKYKCGYINSKGEEITPCIYDSATSFFDCGYALAHTTKKMEVEEGYITDVEWKNFIIDKKGNVVVEIDTIAEKREIKAVYKDYFVCKTEDGEIETFDFQGKKISEIKDSNENTTKNEDFEITCKSVATTQSGSAYGITKNGKTVIPFEYDEICQYGEYFVAIKYTGRNVNFNQTFDIYDKNFNKTAENIKYAFSENRNEKYGSRCQLPNGYFQIIVENREYEWVYGIVDYTGKIIVEPVFGDEIICYTYEGTGVFDWY